MSEWIQNFKDNGFAIINDFITESEISTLKQSCQDLIKSTELLSHISCFSTEDQRQAKDEYFFKSASKISYFFEPEGIDVNGIPKYEPELCLNKIGHALHLHSEFQSLTFGNRVKQIVKSLEFTDPCVTQSMYIFKPPYIGGYVNVHQDASFLYMKPLKLLGLWIALDDANIENGCLQFIPGSHKNTEPFKRFIRQQKEGTGQIEMIFQGEELIFDECAFVPAEVQKGSCILIDGLVIHRSEKNTSACSRNAYTFHIAETFNTEWSSLNWLQPTPDFQFTKIFN